MREISESKRTRSICFAHLIAGASDRSFDALIRSFDTRSVGRHSLTDRHNNRTDNYGSNAVVSGKSITKSETALSWAFFSRSIWHHLFCCLARFTVMMIITISLIVTDVFVVIFVVSSQRCSCTLLLSHAFIHRILSMLIPSGLPVALFLR
jgi:hypothetical protein